MSTPPPPSTPTIPLSSSTDPTSSPDDTPLPMALTTSLLLTSLPPDATAALELATAPPPTNDKVTIRFQSIGNAPMLKRKVFKISSGARFEKVVAFLRKQLGMDEEGGNGGGMVKGEGLWCYVNQSFAPALDVEVGGLWRCFKTDDQLVVSYCKSVAFG